MPLSNEEVHDIAVKVASSDNESEVEAIISKLPDSVVDYVFDIVNDIRIDQQVNPINKFKTDRESQMNFISNSHVISIALCGNQWGKSFAMAYKIVSIALSVDKTAHHLPDKTRDVEVVVVGPSWGRLSETIQKDIMSLLRDDQYTTKSNGTYINKIVIKSKKGKTNILFMPSSSEKKTDSQEFEGSKYHYAFVDEGISATLFRKIMVRLGSAKGRFYQAFTRLPETMHLAGYLIDLEKGKGEFSHYIDMGWVKIIRESNIENKYLDDSEKLSLMAGAGTANDLKVFREEYEPLLGKKDADSIKKRNKIVKKFTKNFKARILGIMDRPQGSVFNFNEELDGESYNVFKMSEFIEVLMNEELVWDICHDYGQVAPATWILVATSRKTGTMYVVDEVYKRDMSIEESSQACAEMMKRWKVYGDVKRIFADRQIDNTGRKDKRTDIGITIKNQYKSKYDLEGDPCFPYNIAWICRQSDKNNKLHTMSMLGELIETNNPLTGKPWIRFSYRCSETINEIKMLRWKIKIHKESGADYEDTAGEDHSIDPIRYMINNKINKRLWDIRHKIALEFNEMAYNINGCGNSLILC